MCVCGVYGAKDRRHACERSPMDVITPIHPCRWLSLDVGRDGVCGGCRAVYCSSVVCRVPPSKRVETVPHRSVAHARTHKNRRRENHVRRENGAKRCLRQRQRGGGLGATRVVIFRIWRQWFFRSIVTVMQLCYYYASAKLV